MYIGFDIGGTNIKGVLTDIKGSVLKFRKISTKKTAEGIEEGLVSLVDEFSSGRNKKLKAVGIGAAGAIDKKKGIILTSPNVSSWKRYPMVKILEKRTGIKVFLENDATAAVIGEWWQGNGRKFSNWIMLTLGTGIGGGAIIDNKIYTGQSGSSMEAGHTTIDYKGRKCPCGNRGCLEMYASATAAVRTAVTGLKKHPDSSLNARKTEGLLTSEIIHEEALKGDRFAEHVLAEVAEYLGYGIANLVSIFNPEAVILGGGLSHAHRILIPVVKRVVRERVMEGLKENIRYLLVKDEEKTPALGAAKAAMDALAAH